MIPELIEIVPLTEPVRAEITVPGSKSITNRSLILAALAAGKVTLHGALWSEDTQVMADCLQKLGFEVSVAQDPDEACNRTITVQGLGGRIPKGGTAEQPLELFVGNAGTAARFLAAMVCLGNGVYRLHGVPRMHERPQVALFQALRQLGYRVDSANDKLPAVIHGQMRNAECGMRNCTVSIAESSQFASALLLSARTGGWEIEIEGENADESPYVAMTAKFVKYFASSPNFFHVEPDASSGSYYWAAGWLGTEEGWQVSVAQWPVTQSQVDAQFTKYLPLPRRLSREGQLGDSIMTAMVLAPFARESTLFADLSRLRVQECERVEAMRTELTRCGAEVLEHGETLTICPSNSQLHGAEIETYNDHRMAMCFAILGLKVPGIKIKNPACVKKTFPNFFQKLAALPPRGLGATILDGHTGRKLELEELFAD